MQFQLKSSAFRHGEAIPEVYSNEKKDLSPPLEWSQVPKGTCAFALLCEDPDAPSPEPWVHWLLYNLPASTTTLPEGIRREPEVPIAAGVRQGKNSWGDVGYHGPLPPEGHGWHRYYFKLYALDTSVILPEGADKDTLLSAIRYHIIGETALMGRYQRKQNREALPA